MLKIKNETKIILVFLLGVLVVNIPITTKFSKSYTGYYCNINDMQNAQKKTIKLEGKITNAIAGFRNFKGKFIMDEKAIDVEIAKSNSKQNIIYKEIRDVPNSAGFAHYALMYCDSLNSDIFLGFYKSKGQGYSFSFDDNYIFVSSKNLKKSDIQKMVNKLIK